MKTDIIEVKLKDNNIQKYQVVTNFKWEDLVFKSPPFNKQSIKAVASLYEINIVPKRPQEYGFLLFYNINNLEIDLDRNTEIGYIFENQLLLNYYFNKARDEGKINIVEGTLVFEDAKLNSYYNYLLDNEYLVIVKGDLNSIMFLPMSNDIGYLSKIKKSKLLVNSHFFILDETDIDSTYDEIGTPHGFALSKSKIILPPLNHRECLLVDYNNNVEISNLEVQDFKIRIDNEIFIDSFNSKFYTRPNYRITPKCNGSAIVVVNNKIVAIKEKGEVTIPMAGFVIQCENTIKYPFKDDKIEFFGRLDDYKFGLQVGPSMIIDNNQIKDFRAKFYNGEGIAFPSTRYPLDFNNGRAARIGIGEKDGKPILIWAEGAGKLGHKKGKESCGASLLEFSDFCKSYKITNLVNLDGGGSAQIVINGEKKLKIADRENDAVTEIERPIPIVLSIE